MENLKTPETEPMDKHLLIFMAYYQKYIRPVLGMSTQLDQAIKKVFENPVYRDDPEFLNNLDDINYTIMMEAAIAVVDDDDGSFIYNVMTGRVADAKTSENIIKAKKNIEAINLEAQYFRDIEDQLLEVIKTHDSQRFGDLLSLFIDTEKLPDSIIETSQGRDQYVAEMKEIFIINPHIRIITAIVKWITNVSTGRKVGRFSNNGIIQDIRYYIFAIITAISDEIFYLESDFSTLELQDEVARLVNKNDIQGLLDLPKKLPELAKFTEGLEWRFLTLLIEFVQTDPQFKSPSPSKLPESK